MQNYGGYYQQYPQGQNNMYQGSSQNNMNQSNMRNMFGVPQNYGMPQMPQVPQQQYGYQQQQQMPQQQNFVFHFDINNTPSNMNMNMGPYAPTNPQQYGAPPYGGIQMQQNDTQKKEDKNSELFDAFDPFNPKKRTQSKPRSQPQQIEPVQQPAAPQQPQIQMIEDNAPKKQDLNAFRTAFASLAGPTQQPQPQLQPQQQYGMQPGQMYQGNMQAPSAPQIEGFNFAGGMQGTQPPQIDGFNFGSPPPQQNPSFANPLSPPQQVQPAPPGVQSQPQANNNAASKNAQEDIFANFNPLSPSRPAAPDNQAGNQSSNSNQYGSSDAFSFNQPSGNIQSFNQPQAGSNGGILSFNQPQAATTDPIQSFTQPQTGSSGNFAPFGQQQVGSTGGISNNQPQTGSGGGFTSFEPQQTGSTGGILSFNVPQASTIDPIQSFNSPQAGSGSLHAPFSVPQAGSTGGLPLNEIDDLFGSPTSKNQPQQQQQQQPATTSNPFLLNVNTDSNPFVNTKKNKQENPIPLTPSPNNNTPEHQQQNNNSFNPFGSSQIQSQNQANPTSTSTSFANSFRQAIGEAPQQQPTPEPQKPTEEKSADFHNIFNQGHNFFEQQEQQFKTEQQQHESFTFGSQATSGDSGTPNFSNFTFNSSSQPESTQNPQFGNFGVNETQQPQQQQSTPFTPFGVSDLQPMPNSTFVISGSGDSVSSQPTPVSADPVSTENIPYFAEQEKKMELENRLKNDTMSVFDPFNPNPQSLQQQNPQQNEVQQQQQQQQQNKKSQQEEQKLSASVNASVDTIRNMFGGPPDQNEEKANEKEEDKNQETETNQEVSQQNDETNQNIFLGGFSSGFGTENNDSQSKPSDIQLNVGIGEESNSTPQNNEFDNPFNQGGFQGNFGRSPEANSFGFGGFGFNNSFGKGNVFQHAFEQTNFEKPATFADFFPQHNSQPLSAPVNIEQTKDDQKETEKTTKQQQQPPKSETPFATGFDLMDIMGNTTKQGESDKQHEDNPFIFDNKKQTIDFNNPFGVQDKKDETNKQQNQDDNQFVFTNQQQQKIDFNNPFGQTETEPKQQQQKQEEEKKEEQTNQTQKDADLDNPFINQSNLTLFGQDPSKQQTAQQAQTKESFNPFGSNDRLETAPQSSSLMSLTSTDIFTPQAEVPKQQQQQQKQANNKNKQKKESNKTADIFDEIPDDVSEIDKSLPEKPPPFIMPTIGDSSSNPFTNVLGSLSASSTSNPFTSTTNNNSNASNPFVSASSTPSSNPFTSENKKEEEESKKNNESNPFTFDSNKQIEKDNDEPKKGNNNLDDLIGFGFDFSSPKPENQQQQQQQQSEKTQSNENPFLASFGTQPSQEIETKQEDKKEEQEKTEEEKTPDTSGFTFASATATATANDTNDANPFSKGFNPFGGDFSNPFASSTAATATTTTNDSQNGGFTFTPTFDNSKEKENENDKENKDNEAETTKLEPNDETKSDKKEEEKEVTNITGTNMNIVDTLDDDLFDMNSIEKYEPKQQRSSNKNSDLFGDIHTFPVSNSTSDFLEMKQKKEAKNNSVGQSVLMMSDGVVGNKVASSPFANNNNNNININNNNGIISILDPYQNNLTDELAFSASSDGDNDPDVLKVMSDDNQMSKILKKFIKPPENDFYGSFEKDPHPIRIFPKFDDTKAAKVLADFVSNQFGITASFASTSKKQKEEIDMNSIFNAPAASEPNDDDDFLLII